MTSCKMNNGTRALIHDLSEQLRRWKSPFEGGFQRQSLRSASCAVCGARATRHLSVRAVHARSLREGRPTGSMHMGPLALCSGISLAFAFSKAFDTLVQGTPLVNALRSVYPDIEGQLGCCELVFGGLIAKSEILKIWDNPSHWGQATVLRENALRTPLTAWVIDYEPAKTRNRQLRKFKIDLGQKYSRDPSLIGTDNWVLDYSQAISLARRSSNAAHFEWAQMTAKRLQKWLDHEGNILSIKTGDRGYYELALMQMVDHHSPNLTKATRLLRRSCSEAKKVNNRAGWAMSALEWVHARTLSATVVSASQYRRLVAIQDECQEILGAISGKGGVGSIMRWQVNRLIHRARLQLKAGRIGEAEASSSDAWALRDQLTVETGWRSFQLVHLATVDGIVNAHRGRYAESLECLADSIKYMTSPHAKRPEGFRDIAQCAAWVLDKLLLKDEAVRVRQICEKMVDGRSGVWSTPQLY